MHFSLSAASGLRHRHLLAVPVAVLAIGLSVAGALMERSGAQTVVKTEVQQVQPGLWLQQRGQAEWSTDASGVRLRSGEVIVQAQDRAQLMVAQARVFVLHGLADIRLADGTLTVVALDASVLVQLDDHLALVPPGRQWRTAEPELAPVTDWSGWLADRETLPAPADLLRTLRASFQSGGTEPASSLPSVLSPESWLLALAHPAYRDRAWRMVPSASSPEATAVALLLAPHADLQADPASDAIRRRLQAGMTALLDEQGVRLRMAYAPFLERVVQEMQERGMVDRAQFYGDLLAQVRTGVAMSASAASVAPSVSSSSCAALEHAQALQATVALLAKLNAQRTTKTAISPQGTDRVRVQAMAFPGKTADQLLSFTFDPGCGLIEEIEQNGQVMPNSLTLAQFVAWVGEE